MNQPDNLLPAPPRRIKFHPSDVERFWRKVKKDGPIVREGIGNCWLWNAGKSPSGYGVFYVNGRSQRAHRIGYEIQFGDIPEGMMGCHRCDNPSCVRPDHIFPGTTKDNSEDARRKGRLATGDRSPSRLHPESRPRGIYHHSKTHPESMPRGERHGSKTHPESTPRGEECFQTKLTTDQVREIRARRIRGNRTNHPDSTKALALEFGVSRILISHIANRRVWKHVP